MREGIGWVIENNELKIFFCLPTDKKNTYRGIVIKVVPEDDLSTVTDSQLDLFAELVIDRLESVAGKIAYTGYNWEEFCAKRYDQTDA